jgi:ABC-type lipoprotein export system ATPase subunit
MGRDSSRRPRPPVALRRMGVQRTVLVAVVLTVALTAVFAAALAAYSGQAGNAAVRSAPAGSSAGTSTSILFTGSTPQEPAAAATGYLEGRLSSALGGAGVAVDAAPELESLALPGSTQARGRVATLLGAQDLSAHARLVAGSWPAAGAISQNTASLLRLHVGGTVRVDTPTGDAVEFTVAGVFSPEDLQSAYRGLDPLGGVGEQAGTNYTTFGPFFTDPSYLAAGSPADGGALAAQQMEWEALPDLAEFGTGGLATRGANLSSLLANLGQDTAIGAPQASTGLPQLLAGLSSAALVARSLVSAELLELLVVAIAALLIVVRLLTETRETEAALPWARGGTGPQLLRPRAVESLLLAAPAVLLAPFTAQPLAAEIGRLGGGERRQPALPRPVHPGQRGVAGGGLPGDRPGQRRPRADHAAGPVPRPARRLDGEARGPGRPAGRHPGDRDRGAGEPDRAQAGLDHRGAGRRAEPQGANRRRRIAVPDGRGRRGRTDRGSQSSSLQQALTAASPLSRAVPAQPARNAATAWAGSPGPDAAVLGQTLGGLAAGVPDSAGPQPGLGWDGVSLAELLPESARGAPAKTNLEYRSDETSHMRVLSGTMPDAATDAAGTLVLDVAVTKATADRYGARLGSVVAEQGYGFRVTAIVAPTDPGSAFWADDPGLAAPGFTITPKGDYWATAGFIGPGELSALESMLLFGAVALVSLAGPPIIAVLDHRGAATLRTGRADLVRRRPRPRPRRRMLELLLPVLAIGAVVELRQQGLGEAGQGTNALGTLVPILLAAVATAIAVRCYPLLLGPAARAAARRGGPTSFLGPAGAARSAVALALPTFVIVLTLTLAALGSMMNRTVEDGRVAASWQQTGADAVVSLNSSVSWPQASSAVSAIDGVPGVTHASVVYSQPDAVSGGVVYAVDPSTYAAVSADSPWPVDAGELASSGGRIPARLPGHRLPGRLDDPAATRVLVPALGGGRRDPAADRRPAGRLRHDVAGLRADPLVDGRGAAAGLVHRGDPGLRRRHRRGEAGGRAQRAGHPGHYDVPRRCRQPVVERAAREHGRVRISDRDPGGRVLRRLRDPALADHERRRARQEADAALDARADPAPGPRRRAGRDHAAGRGHGARRAADRRRAARGVRQLAEPVRVHRAVRRVAAGLRRGHPAADRRPRGAAHGRRRGAAGGPGPAPRRPGATANRRLRMSGDATAPAVDLAGLEREAEAEARRRAGYGTDALIPCDRVVRVYAAEGVEVQALQGLDLQVAPGVLTAIVGASDSGKSTLLNILSGLDRPTAGRARVADHDLLTMKGRERLRYRRETVGFIWQQTGRNLLPYLDAAENIETPSRLAGTRKAARRERARELLNLLGIEYCAERRPGQLSGGEQQRVAIGVALANRPKVVLADEPTGELDTASADTVFQALRTANEQLGVAVLIVTHDENVSTQVPRTV